MVCKEEVYLWFQNLRGSKRIEAMCCFLNMCYPLELRFYGTCMEDMGRKDFYVFKDDEIKANDLSEVLKIRNIHEHSTRSRLIVMLSLLNSSNTICAKELFKVLSEEIKIEILASLGVLSDFNMLEHYLLVLTLAQHHPAFTFEQQTFLTNLSLALESYVTELCSKMKCEDSYLPISYVPGRIPSHGIQEKIFSNVSRSYRHTPPRCSDSQQNQVQITSLKVKPPHRKMCLRIRVAWGNDKVTDAYKTPHDLLVFHQKLVQKFPSEAKNNNQDKCIPPLPHIIGTWNKQNNINDSVATSAAEYIQQLNSRLPSFIVESEFFRNFFMPSNPNRAALARNNRIVDNGLIDVPQRSSRLRSLTIYNSRISDNSPRHHPENRQKNLPVAGQRKQYENGSNMCSRPSPVNSPIESPLSSPYASPLNSETSSRAPSPWNTAPSNVDRSVNTCSESPGIERIQPKEMIEHWDPLRNYKIDEIQAMPFQDLENLGAFTGSKLAKDPDAKSHVSPPNGIIGCYIPKSALFLKSGPLMQSNSNDSSPVCSEYSSPPQSPSPGETCNQSSSLSSGNEENIEKKSLSKVLTEVCKIDETGSSIPDSPFKRTDDDSVCMKGNLSRSSVSVIPFAAPYSSIVTPMPPPQSMKPAYLPITCRTNNAPQHLSPGAVVFDNQFSRVPLPSALTFLPGPQRSHAATPDRVLSPSSLPISTVSPFPVVTSGCTTVPSATCSITTHRSSNVTTVTHSGASSNRYTPKNSNVARDSDIVNKPVQQAADTPYATGYILNTSSPLTAVSCSCFTTNSARPSPAPSPSIMSPGATPQPSAVPVSMSYLGMPYLFHSIPFLQAQTPANGFVPQPGIANSGQGFSYTLPNGMTAISPELIYPGQTFTLQSPSTQSNPCPVATPASQCYGAFPQTSAVPMKLVTCYNCGKVGHRGPECKEQSMDDMNKSGKFQLNFNPLPKISDCHE
ncbi:zinc finger CCHC domain-containing protein 2 [Nephila pilipes]|uniref:Zinc finger CCHC domain-containing protein 2 n=1 Tax=Nephila pilipes TaxID=299642 RepID=A0A8X6TG05_NEPPI|nr:zinc finger CCHC domain-containing protein 2 [Nephila pilipes]